MKRQIPLIITAIVGTVLVVSVFIPHDPFGRLGTMFSILAFFVASASYRAFRAKSREATILLIAAFIILLGRTPIGDYITFWLPGWLNFFHIPILANWIMAIPNLAGQRAIMIGISLGVVSMSLRLILGIERGYIGSEGK
ncbi:MAG: hypothetical protein B6D58_02470 [candidate division Zixibacteria bacterium 4484_95]|nr:MAG: hypothetical protein B6D58_02470 [candidate division Zixibacteria bacterium 4484_95]